MIFAFLARHSGLVAILLGAAAIGWVVYTLGYEKAVQARLDAAQEASDKAKDITDEVDATPADDLLRDIVRPKSD